MKTTGFTRKVDDLGRIVIPKEIRESLKIPDNSLLEIHSDGCSIIIKKIEKNCVLCNSKVKLLEFNDKYICKKCLENLTKIKEH